MSSDPISMRLLLVEDEPELLRILAQALREADYAVDTAEDGLTGLAKACATDYDAVVLDIMLPGLDGLKVLAELRAVKSTPVLLLTARDTIRDRVQGLDQGADDYLVKPFALDELLARLRALIRRTSGEATPLLEFGGLALNTAAKTVIRDGQTITLTAREYSLLEYLALRRGRVVTRTTLYEHLFDEDDESVSNLLDVHVANIRRKIGAEVIHTRRGQGYIIP